MRLIKKCISGHGGGYVVLCPLEAEDMWHAFNIIAVGDSIKATTIRKVVNEGDTAVQSQRVKVTVMIQVSKIDFDPVECCIRVMGKNIEENKFIKLGAHHTVELEPNRNFTVTKLNWDSLFIERIETACNPSKSASLAAVVMEMGVAHVCLVTSAMTLIRAKIEKSIPKKRAASKNHKDGVAKFFEQVLQAIVRDIDFEIVKCVIVSSPGYVKDDFFKYLVEESSRRSDLKDLLKNKDRFILVHASSGYTQALDQVLSDPGIQTRLADVQAAREVQVLHKFFKMLNENSEKAFYSYGHVQAAQDRGAIASLLVSDSLFRSTSIKTRKQYVDLVEACRASGAQVHIFSSLHPSGEQLEQLSGVAAILRYPLPDLDDLEIHVESDDDYGGIPCEEMYF